MRFKRIETREKQKTRSENVREERSSASRVDTSQTTLGEAFSLPLEWEPLRSIIEGERARQIPAEQLQESHARLMGLVRRAMDRQVIIREYLSQTFWPRWTMRAATALSIALLLILAGVQQRNITQMHARVGELEHQVQTLQAGM